MSTNTDAKALRLFDVRTIDRNIKKGLVTRKDYEKHLKALEDATSKVAPPEEETDAFSEEADEIDDDDTDVTAAPTSETT